MKTSIVIVSNLLSLSLGVWLAHFVIYLRERRNAKKASLADATGTAATSTTATGTTANDGDFTAKTASGGGEAPDVGRNFLRDMFTISSKLAPKFKAGDIIVSYSEVTESWHKRTVSTQKVLAVGDSNYRVAQWKDHAGYSAPAFEESEVDFFNTYSTRFIDERWHLETPVEKDEREASAQELVAGVQERDRKHRESFRLSIEELGTKITAKHGAEPARVLHIVPATDESKEVTTPK